MDKIKIIGKKWIKTIFIEIPSWLGDAIMATPSYTKYNKKHIQNKITLLGSFVSKIKLLLIIKY